jgi:hypothetical protein
LKVAKQASEKPICARPATHGIDYVDVIVIR